MKVKLFISLFLLFVLGVSAQAQDMNRQSSSTHPAVTNWLINTTGITGRHYIQGNTTPIVDTAQANVQRVQYSNDYSYIECSGIPAYIIGPYLDGNPAIATNNQWLFRIPLNPVENTGQLTGTPLGPVGLLINGVPIYDFKDAASYSLSQGGDAMMGGDGVWNRNAILAENDGFDCAKGHPSPIFAGPPGPGGQLVGGSYHHHQNPMAFNLDLAQVSDVCDLYLADGLYILDSTTHSPLLGFAFDGYPIYGGYAHENPNGTGSIVRMRSGYKLRNITERTHYADGTNVTDGPDVSAQYPLGWYREDYEFDPNAGDLDEHNGRFCVTPDYPNGTYAYFTTVDENWNSTYPYIIGPRYFGVVATENFSGPGGNNITINEPVTLYTPSSTSVENELEKLDIVVFPNPASDVIAIQVGGILKRDLSLKLFDITGKLVKETEIHQGSTIWHFDTRTLYDGEYMVHISDGTHTLVKKVLIVKD